MDGERITFDCKGETFDGYLSRPAGASGPGVIVIQEWWGLVGHITDVADRFAAEGFVALAPDLYRGKTTAEPDEAGSLMMALNIGKTERQLSCAVDYLLAHSACSSEKAGVVGFCMGGQLSLLAATINDKIGACVDFYGIHPNVNPDLSNLRAPLLGIFAENDSYASPATVKKLDADLNRLGKLHEFVTYPGTQHAFFNSDRPEVYNELAAQDAWRRVMALFRREL